MSTIESIAPADFRGFELHHLVETGAVDRRLALRIGEQAAYAVLFGSEQHDDLSPELQQDLTDADDASFYEAQESGGLVAYVRGVGKVAYSACFWQSAADAARAMHGRQHQTRAVPLALSGEVYKQWFVKFYAVSHDAADGFTATPVVIKGHSDALSGRAA